MGAQSSQNHVCCNANDIARHTFRTTGAAFRSITGGETGKFLPNASPCDPAHLRLTGGLAPLPVRAELLGNARHFAFVQ